MKILLTCLDYPTSTNSVAGGVAAAIKDLAGGLSEKKNLDIHILNYTKSIISSFSENQGQITIHHLAHKGSPNFVARYTIGILRIYKAIRTINPDIIHCHDPQFFTSAYFQKKPIIMTIHGLKIKESRNYQSFLKKLIGFFQRQFEYFSFLKAKNIISISPYIDYSVKEYTSARFHEVQVPINNTYFFKKDNQVKNRILSVGMIYDRKGFDFLINSIYLVRNFIPDVTLHIVGKVVDKSYYRQLVNLVNERNLSSSVHFKLELPDSQLLKEFKECEIFSLASKEETRPRAMLEAMASGTPIVSVKSGGIPYLIENGKLGLLSDQGDLVRFSKNLVLLMKDKKLKSHISYNSMNYINENFPIEKVTNKTLKVYEEILKS